MKFIKPFYQLRLVLNLTHVVPKDDIFILKYVGINFLLLYVYDNVRMVGFNKIYWSEMHGVKQHELKMHKGQKIWRVFPKRTILFHSLFIVEARHMTSIKYIFIMASRNLVCVIQSK